MLGRWVLRKGILIRLIGRWVDGSVSMNITRYRGWSGVSAAGKSESNYSKVSRICGGDDSAHCTVYGLLIVPPWHGSFRSHLYMIDFVSLIKASPGLSNGLPDVTSI